MYFISTFNQHFHTDSIDFSQKKNFNYLACRPRYSVFVCFFHQMREKTNKRNIRCKKSCRRRKWKNKVRCSFCVCYLYNIIKIQPVRAIVTKHHGRHLFDFSFFFDIGEQLDDHVSIEVSWQPWKKKSMTLMIWKPLQVLKWDAWLAQWAQMSSIITYWILFKLCGSSAFPKHLKYETYYAHLISPALILKPVLAYTFKT